MLLTMFFFWACSFIRQVFWQLEVVWKERIHIHIIWTLMYALIIVLHTSIWHNLLQFIHWISCSSLSSARLKFFCNYSFKYTGWRFSYWSFYILHSCFLWEAKYVWQCFVEQVYLNFSFCNHVATVRGSFFHINIWFDLK